MKHRLWLLGLSALFVVACQQGAPPSIGVQNAAPLENTLVENQSAGGSATIRNLGGGILQVNASSNAPWLSITNQNPILVAAAGQQTLNWVVVCGAPGVYNGVITLTTNDPAKAQETIAIKLTCLQATPDITNPTPANPELSAPVGQNAQAFVQFGNVGSAPLTFTVTVADNWLSVSPVSGSVTPGGSQILNLQATCTNAGSSQTTLTLASNDPDESSKTLTVRRNCQDAPPDITDLGSVIIGKTTTQYQSEYTTITFQNLGGSTLSFLIKEVDPVPWLTVLPPQGTVAPQGTQVLHLGFQCMSVGNFTTQLVVLSNDPDESSKSVEVRLTCNPPTSDFVTAINNARAIPRVCGAVAYGAAPALTWDNRLAAAALKHSLDMFVNNFFDPNGSDGSTPAQRVAQEGYVASLALQNIAGFNSTLTLEQAIQTWIGIPDTCARLMDPVVTQMGLTRMGDAVKGDLWTLVLAKP